MNEIKICMGSSCYARGNDENIETLENYINEHKEDSKIELIGLRCTNKCEKGPVIIINGKEYCNISYLELKKILKEL